MPRRVAVFTSTRADAGPLGPVIEALSGSGQIELQLIVSGTHLSQGVKRGPTELRIPGGTDVEEVPLETDRDDPASFLLASAALTRGLVGALERLRPDVLLVLGDRWELMPVATAAVLLQVPLAHLHGGEVTEGAVDERFRHAITKLADLHLCADEEARRRLLQLGEEPWRVTVTGAPALDRLTAVRPLMDEELAEATGVRVSRPFGLVTYHPPTVDRSDLEQRADAVFDAAAAACPTVIVTHPGPDPGRDVVLARLAAAAQRHEHLHVVPQLGPLYPAVLASADVLIGNSSSGIFEAASFGIPVVNVGSRQQGRTRPANVIDTREDEEQIRDAVATALSPAFTASARGVVNPFGDGNAAERVVEALRLVPLDRLLLKRFVDHPRRDAAR